MFGPMKSLALSNNLRSNYLSLFTALLLLQIIISFFYYNRLRENCDPMQNYVLTALEC